MAKKKDNPITFDLIVATDPRMSNERYVEIMLDPEYKNVSTPEINKAMLLSYAKIAKKAHDKDKKHFSASSRGGKQTSIVKAEELEGRNNRIKLKADEMLGLNNEREITGILARQFELSARQIRNILKQK